MREYKPTPQGLPMETPFGQVCVSVLDESFIGLSGQVKVCGVVYNFRLSLRNYGQGFELLKDDHADPYSSSLLLKRRDDERRVISKSVKQEVVEAMLKLANKWAQDNKKILDEAAIVSLNNTAYFIEREIEAREAHIASLKSRLAEVESKLREMKEDQ